jgi:hypothetical protein
VTHERDPNPAQALPGTYVPAAVGRIIVTTTTLNGKRDRDVDDTDLMTKLMMIDVIGVDVLVSGRDLALAQTGGDQLRSSRA